MRHRNILFITADQLRHDALGFKGIFPVKTPNIDKLAKNGTVFENAHCANPICVASRASIMTGRYCYETGVYYNDQGWDGLETIPGTLSANGYYSAAIGVMHFRPPMKHHGFNKVVNEHAYFPYLEKLGYQGRDNCGFRANFPGEDLSAGKIVAVYNAGPSDIPLKHYITTFRTDKAIEELELISRRRNCHAADYEPFFMWLSYTKPHVPCDPPEPYYSMYNPDDMPPPVRCESEKQYFSQPVRRFSKYWTDVIDEATVKRIRARYAGNIMLVDEQIGRVITKLEELKILDNTLIIFSADHGDHLGDHYLQQKGFFYEPSLKVPLIFCGPDIPQGRIIKDNVSLVDLLPTIRGYAGLEMPDIRDAEGHPVYDCSRGNNSVNLLNLMNEKVKNDTRLILAESGIHGQHIMLKKGRVKINYYVQSSEFDYFDLEEYPDELNNRGREFSFDNIPGDFKEHFRYVLEQTKKYHGKKYFFQKIRPMFS